MKDEHPDEYYEFMEGEGASALAEAENELERKKNIDRNSLLYWFPKIQDLGIPYPKTEIILFLSGFEYINYIDENKGFPQKVTQKLIKELKKKAQKIGYPLFMRTDQLSGKHSMGEWIPYIENEETLIRRIPYFIEESATAGIFGLPLNAFILREFLELDYEFKAFGGMPIARERRYFINNGTVLCHHSYWEKDAIRFWHNIKEPDNWKEQLKRLNTETKDEIEILTDYALKVTSVFDGYWSVDFAYTKDGKWVIIDMADGFQSWHPECKYKIPEIRK